MAISRDDVERLKALEKKTAWLSVICWLQLIAICAFGCVLIPQRRVEAASTSRVLRAKGANH